MASRAKPKSKHSEIEFAVFDLETTGLFAYHGDEICEIGCVILKQGKIIDKFHTLVNPLRPIGIGASAVNGITDDMVKGAPIIEDVLPQFFKFIGERPLVAHNAKFDLSFLNSKFSSSSQRIPTITVIDTLVISRLLYPEYNRHNLTELRRRFSIDVDGEHRALSDAIATAKLLSLFLKKLTKLGITTYKALLKFHGVPYQFDQSNKTIQEMVPLEFAEEIEEALKKQKNIKIQYFSSHSGEISTRVVKPQRIINRNGKGYLIGYCHRRLEQRTFRIDRIKKLKATW